MELTFLISYLMISVFIFAIFISFSRIFIFFIHSLFVAVFRASQRSYMSHLGAMEEELDDDDDKNEMHYFRSPFWSYFRTYFRRHL